jgi:hypothetical protein
VAAKLVILGLLGAMVFSVITGPPAGSLPGIALGSEPLLLVERTLAFFAAWLAVVVIIAQALKGHLPVEISGRGVRYVETSTAGETQARIEAVMRRHEVEIEALRRGLVKVDKQLAAASERID